MFGKDEVSHDDSIAASQECNVVLPEAMKEKWLEALRSGEYTSDGDFVPKYLQGVGALERSGGYCCLGVLQMCMDGKVEKHPNGDSYALPSASWAMEHNIKFDAGKDQSGSFFINLKYRDYWCEAAELNDEIRLSFSEIADIIESQVETY